jgi:rod shape-determining protein MreC
MPGPGRGGRRRYVLVLLVLTAVTLITLDQREGDSGPLGDAGRFAHRVVSPVSNLASDTLDPVSDWFDGVLHAGSLKRDNNRLKRAIAKARIEAARGKAAIEENRLLDALSGQVFLDDIPSVVGRVVASSPGNFERTISLDRGSERGIKRGMPVVAANGLVGRVVEVWSGGCSVLLLEDSKFAVGVRMVRERLTGAAEGRAGSSALRVDFDGPLSARRRPRPKELAETSGLEGTTFPPSIPVGTVEKVTVSDDGLTISVRLVPLVDVTTLEYVKVLLWTTGSSVPRSLSAPTTTTTAPRATTTTAPKTSISPTSTTAGP